MSAIRHVISNYFDSLYALCTYQKNAEKRIIIVRYWTELYIPNRKSWMKMTTPPPSIRETRKEWQVGAPKRNEISPVVGDLVNFSAVFLRPPKVG